MTTFCDATLSTVLYQTALKAIC